MSHVASRNQASIWSVAPLGKTTILADSRRRMAKRHAEERLDTWPMDFHTVRVGSWGQSVDFLLRVAFNKTCPGMNVDVVSKTKKNKMTTGKQNKTWQLKKRTNKSTTVTWICVVSLGGPLFFVFFCWIPWIPKEGVSAPTSSLVAGCRLPSPWYPHGFALWASHARHPRCMAWSPGPLDRCGQDVRCSTVQHPKAHYGR